MSEVNQKHLDFIGKRFVAALDDFLKGEKPERGSKIQVTITIPPAAGDILKLKIKAVKSK